MFKSPWTHCSPRGKNRAPENTLAAINEAAKCGAGWVELDVQLTEDNVPVVIHDRTLERTTNGSGKVKNIDSKSLTSLDAGHWFDARYKGRKYRYCLTLLIYAKIKSRGQS